MKIGSILLVLLSIMTIASCEQKSKEHTAFARIGTIENIELDEASGIQPGSRTEGVYFLHNDDGKPMVFAIDQTGRNRGTFLIEGAANHDWEDMTAIHSETGELLLLADTGDNFSVRDTIQLYFVHEPVPGDDGKFSGQVPLFHSIDLEYPDGSRDCESIAFDPSSETIYLMSKRDKPARLYSISLQDALNQDHAVLKFESEVAVFRPPSARDSRRFGVIESKWISQPTGMDFNQDGTEAVVITYRSLYFFLRNAGEDWPAAFSRKPVEFIGPPDRHEEAVTYSYDGQSVIVSAEGVRSPLFRFRELRETD